MRYAHRAALRGKEGPRTFTVHRFIASGPRNCRAQAEIPYHHNYNFYLSCIAIVGESLYITQTSAARPPEDGATPNTRHVLLHGAEAR